MKAEEALPDFPVTRGWEICEEISSGGYGTVYRVRNRRTGEFAALKWIQIQRDQAASQEDFRESTDRIYSEISMLQKLSDIPEVVKIQSFSVERSADGSQCDALIRMEYLTPLAALLSKGTFTLHDALSMASDIASALEKCHARGVVHGDIKFENILVGKDIFKLSDFGISTALSDLNLLQARAGTRAYQPPEYLLGEKPTPLGDMYSLGIMLYLLLNDGLLPFQEERTLFDQQRALEERRRRVETGDFGRYAAPRGAPPVVSELILRACAPEKQDRYKNAGDLKAALEDIQNHISDEEAAAPIRFYGTVGRSESGALRPENEKTEELVPAGENGSAPVSEIKTDAPSPAPRPRRPGSDEPAPEPEPPVLPVYRRKWFLPVCIALACVIAAAAGIVFLLTRPAPPLNAEIHPGAFSAEIFSAGGQGDLILSPAAQPNDTRRISRSGLPVTVQHLIPASAYTLSSGGRQVQFHTAPADGSLWARGRAEIRQASRAGIEAILEYADIDLSGYIIRSGEPQGDRLVLENQLRQGTRAFLICTAQYLGPLPDGEVPLVAVLRTGNGEIYQKESACVLSDASCLIVAEITELFEQRFTAFQAPFYGSAALELYVNGGQAGYMEIKTEKKLSEDL